MSQVADDLRKAADIVNVQGWTKGSMRNAEGQVCVLGALRIATAGKAVWADMWDTIGEEEADRFHKARYVLHNWLGTAPTVWNDTIANTKQEVILVLLKAARSAQ